MWSAQTFYCFAVLKRSSQFKTDRYTTSFKSSYPLNIITLISHKNNYSYSPVLHTFSNQPHFNRFHSSRIAFTSGLLSVFCPSPAIRNPDSVPDNIYHIFQLLSLSAGSGLPPAVLFRPAFRLSHHFLTSLPSLTFSVYVLYCTLPSMPEDNLRLILSSFFDFSYCTTLSSIRNIVCPALFFHICSIMNEV